MNTYSIKNLTANNGIVWHAVVEATLTRVVDRSTLMMNIMKQLCTNTLTYAHKKNSKPFLILFCVWVFLGAGCTSLRPDFETPSVIITSFNPLSSQVLTPRFEIGMRVVNPNATELSLRGMSYKGRIQVRSATANAGLV